MSPISKSSKNSTAPCDMLITIILCTVYSALWVSTFSVLIHVTLMQSAKHPKSPTQVIPPLHEKTDVKPLETKEGT